MHANNILVVEDDLLVGSDIVEKLARHGYVGARLINKGIEALDWAVANKPELVICDIDLGVGMDGVEVARCLRQNSFVPIIFLTAYGHSSLTELMKNFESIVYLSKPIRLVDLITNVELMLGKKDKVKIGYEQTVKSNFCNDSLFIPDGNTYKRLLIDEIIFFEADGNYVSIVMTNGKELIATNLGTVEKQLDRDVFVRISRKHIINYHFIDSVNGTVVVICKKALPLGDTYKKRLMETIGVLRTKCE